MALNLNMDFTIIDDLAEALILLLPAMVANATPVVVKGRKPIDGGRLFIDGRRLLGDGKTWEGAAGGLAAGVLVALILDFIMPSKGLLVLGSAAALGAIIGDIAGSFVKRRIGLERGAPAPLLDQLDFYVGALVMTALLGVRWDLVVVVEAGLTVALLHVASNIVAYLAGLKKVPW